MSLRPPVLRVDPGDEERLRTQARRMVAGPAEVGPGPRLLQVVTFRLGGRPCAVEGRAIARAVARLGPMTEVPLAGGGSRPVAWVDEQPLAVTDLAAAAGHPPQPPAAMARAPALLVHAGGGLAALAVEGPLELGEVALAESAGASLAGLPGPSLAGRLDGGVALLDAGWVLAQAAGAAAP